MTDGLKDVPSPRCVSLSLSLLGIVSIVVSPLSLSKFWNRPACCACRVFQVGCSLVGSVQWMSGIRGAYCYDLVVSDEYVSSKAQVRECSFYGFSIEYAGL